MKTKGISNFQIAIIGASVLFLIVAVLIFSGAIKTGKDKGSASLQGTVVIWGTIKRSLLNSLLDDFNREHSNFSTKYIEKDPATFDQEFLEALASGRGPDLFMLPNDLILRHKDKVYPIPYASILERTFRDTFISEAELYLDPSGILALPITIDPLVMYYNRGALESAGISKPPATWGELSDMIPSISQKDANNRILKSAVALGEFDNINHAKDIVSTVFLQAGNPIVSKEKGELLSTLGRSSSSSSQQTKELTEKMLSFYTSFANQLNKLYSWNRSLPDAQSSFLAGNLVFYFGYASELFSIQNQNPNLDFDVAMIPQIKDQNFKLTFGQMNALAVSRASKNLSTAVTAASLFSGQAVQVKLAGALSLPPVRRDLLSQKPENPYASVFYNSALISRAWLDPNPKGTQNLFRDMIRTINSGQFNPAQALPEIGNQLDLLLIQTRASASQ